MLKRGALRVLGVAAEEPEGRLRAAEIVTDGHEIREVGALRDYAAGPPGEGAGTLGQLARDFPRCELIGLDLPWQTEEDAEAIAAATGRPVVRDFASADLRMGGLGAPLCAFYHFALARRLGCPGPVALVEVRARTVLSWIDPRLPLPQSDGALLAFEAGPGRALGQRVFSGASEAGAVADDVLDRFLAGRHFLRLPPKLYEHAETARLLSDVAALPPADAAATLSACAAAAILAGLDLCPVPHGEILLAGGGGPESLFERMLAAGADVPIRSLAAAGVEEEGLAAQAAAFLAARAVRGLPTSAPGTTGVAAAVGGGEILRPSAGAAQGG